MGYSSSIRYGEDYRIIIIDENDKLMSDISKVVKDIAFKARENDWTDEEMEEKSRYAAYRIISDVESFLRN